MSLWENLKKGFMEGIQTATDKTAEYTKIGRIKIDVLGVKKETEEKLLELGGRLYHLVVVENRDDIRNDKYIMQLIEQIKDLEAELQAYSDELDRIKITDGIDLD